MAGPAVRGLGTLAAGAVPGPELGLERPQVFVGEGERRGSPAAARPSPRPRAPALSRGAAGVVVRLGAASGPWLPAPNRRPLQASGEAVFDLHFLLSHGARAAPSSVTPAPGADGCSADPPAFPRPSPRPPKPQGGFPRRAARAPAPLRPPTAPARSLSTGGSSLGAGDRSSPPGRVGKRRRAVSRRPGGGREARPRVALWKRGNGCSSEEGFAAPFRPCPRVSLTPAEILGVLLRLRGCSAGLERSRGAAGLPWLLRARTMM